MTTSQTIDVTPHDPGPRDRSHRQVLTVLGMHRSGTSAVSQVLALLGGELPGDLIPGDAANERGYFEPISLVHAHDRYLKSISSRWDRLAPLSWATGAPYGEEELALREELRDALSQWTDGAAPLIIKDPRLCTMFPPFAEVCHELGMEISCLIVYRHPTAVAKSIETRDGLPREHGYLLWLRSVLEAEAVSRAYPRSFLSSDELLGDPDRAITTICSTFGTILPNPPSDANRTKIKEFLSPELYHHRAPAAKENTPALPSIIERTYAAVLQASASGTDLSSAWDELREELATLDLLTAPVFRAFEVNREKMEQTLANLEIGVEKLEQSKSEQRRLTKHADELQRHARNLEQDLATAQKRLATAHQELTEERATVKAIETSISWQVTSPLRAVRARLQKTPTPEDR